MSRSFGQVARNLGKNIAHRLVAHQGDREVAVEAEHVFDLSPHPTQSGPRIFTARWCCGFCGVRRSGRTCAAHVTPSMPRRSVGFGGWRMTHGRLMRGGYRTIGQGALR